MHADFQSTFVALRSLLEAHASTYTAKDNSPRCYTLEAQAGPASVAAWGGKVRKAVIPVAWVESGKAYVSYHLMGLSGNAGAIESMSQELRARMQGKTCFNFTTTDPKLFSELSQVTERVLADFKKAGFVV